MMEQRAPLSLALVASRQSQNNLPERSCPGEQHVFYAPATGLSLASYVAEHMTSEIMQLQGCVYIFMLTL